MIIERKDKKDKRGNCSSAPNTQHTQSAQPGERLDEEEWPSIHPLAPSTQKPEKRFAHKYLRRGKTFIRDRKSKRTRFEKLQLLFICTHSLTESKWENVKTICE